MDFSPKSGLLGEKIAPEHIVRNIIKNRLVETSRVKATTVAAVRQALVEHLGVSLAIYRRWENNSSQPDLANALRIAQFFDEDVRRIFIYSTIPAKS